jgi:hypothetical protein
MQATTLDDTLVEVTTARFALTLMSACGTKQTCSMRWQMSAFGAKRTVTNRCLPIPIYEYTA